jgi:hypothetical protein
MLSLTGKLQSHSEILLMAMFSEGLPENSESQVSLCFLERRDRDARFAGSGLFRLENNGNAE